MKRNSTISIIGHFGGNENFLDGQTVKTKILYEELKSKTDWNIIKVDTYYKRTRPIKLVVQTLNALIKSNYIIILLSKNGMKFYFPILYWSSKIFKKNIYHDVLGGTLDKYVKKYPKYKKYLNEFKYNWVETNGLKNRLTKLGIENCEIIPNFKRLSTISEEELIGKKISKSSYKFCTFSRVMKEKGIEDAINAVLELNKENNNFSYFLDIYGPIDPDYEERFQKILKNSDKEINYCGQVPFDKSVEVLKNYDILLFPTYWHGEGFPGTIIDAFSAGLPVVATDWNCNKEIIDNNITGIIYPSENINTLKEAIKKIISNNDLFFEMRKECLKKSKEYQPDKYINNIINEIKKGE